MLAATGLISGCISYVCCLMLIGHTWGMRTNLLFILATSGAASALFLWGAFVRFGDDG